LDLNRLLETSDKTFLAQTAALFLLMVCERILGRTRFGSLIGLAQAVVLFIVKTLFGRIVALFKRGTPQKEEKKDGSVNREEG